MENFKEGTLLYSLAAAVVLFVTAQSLFFIVKAWKRGKQLGIAKETLKDTVISSALFTVAPAISILATVLSLASALGLVLPWIRLTVIGNLAYETVSATEALNAIGSSFTTGVRNAADFSTVAWVMTIGASFPLVLLPIFCKKLHKTMGKITGKSEKTKKLGDILGSAAFIGIMAAFVSQAIAGKNADFSAGILSVSVLLSAMIFTVALDYLCIKKKLTKLSAFVLPVSMFAAMGIAMLLNSVLPEICAVTWR